MSTVTMEERETRSNQYPYYFNIDNIFPLEDPIKVPDKQVDELLNDIEEDVERLRQMAIDLEYRRDKTLSALEAARNHDVMKKLTPEEMNDKQGICERISHRCLTIEVFVLTTRNKEQEEALNSINQLIDKLIFGLKSDIQETRMKCQSYYNACQPDDKRIIGNIDKKFENILLCCTIDDQKKIKRRLEGLLDYITKAVPYTVSPS